VPGKEPLYEAFGFRRMTTAVAILENQEQTHKRGTPERALAAKHCVCPGKHGGCATYVMAARCDKSGTRCKMMHFAVINAA
jgi:hypothetical protein